MLLNTLPYEEQLHWKQYNEAPRGPISKRAFTTDFQGSWATEYDPLQSLKSKLRKLHEEQVPWWNLRSGDLFDKTYYPVTTSPDEWADEILNLECEFGDDFYMPVKTFQFFSMNGECVNHKVKCGVIEAAA